MPVYARVVAILEPARWALPTHAQVECLTLCIICIRYALCTHTQTHTRAHVHTHMFVYFALMGALHRRRIWYFVVPSRVASDALINGEDHMRYMFLVSMRYVHVNLLCAIELDSKRCILFTARKYESALEWLDWKRNDEIGTNVVSMKSVHDNVNELWVV